jgi:cell surface protein SprA
MFSKALLHWYNTPQGLGTPMVEILPGAMPPRGSEEVYPLVLEYLPRSRGAYNYSMNLQRTLLNSPSRNWAGISRELPGRPRDFGKEGIHSISLWMNIVKGEIGGDGRLMIDVGTFSEDALPNHKLNSEDIIRTPQNPNGIPRGVADEYNDLGLDMLSDSQEIVVFKNFIDSNKSLFPEILTDPSGDDYAYESQTADFSHINGLEGSRQIKREPDTEDLNHDNFLEEQNDYVEYELGLDTSSQNPQRVAAGTKGWYQYRIRLTDYASVIGKPDLTQVNAIRVWFTGFSQDVTVKIWYFYFDVP